MTLQGRQCGLEEQAEESFWIRLGCGNNDGPFVVGCSKWSMDVVGSACVESAFLLSSVVDDGGDGGLGLCMGV